MLESTQDVGATPPLSQRIHQIRASLPSQVLLVAVTKQVEVGRMRLAYQAGIRDFAESRVQDLHEKKNSLRTSRT
ncbi:hypothetical protein [Candidatus Cyanaurora vandensis]|uniref:hypothetical protein n=1 Tax=Candidatus Cyanaurora vandensis TaxID=2714958 RepID=UPI00257DCB00|nr:hypothetical protein [Candidatus Cyanaurora vandensis]